MMKKKGIIFRLLNFILVFKKYELFENLIFLDKLEQAMCEILIKITVVSQPKITGTPNDDFHLNALKTLFRLSRVLSDL